MPQLGFLDKTPLLVRSSFRNFRKILLQPDNLPMLPRAVGANLAATLVGREAPAFLGIHILRAIVYWV